MTQSFEENQEQMKAIDVFVKYCAANPDFEKSLEELRVRRWASEVANMAREIPELKPIVDLLDRTGYFAQYCAQVPIRTGK